jgi:hypothetical protein
MIQDLQQLAQEQTVSKSTCLREAEIFGEASPSTPKEHFLIVPEETFHNRQHQILHFTTLPGPNRHTLVVDLAGMDSSSILPLTIAMVRQPGRRIITTPIRAIRHRRRLLQGP